VIANRCVLLASALVVAVASAGAARTQVDAAAPEQEKPQASQAWIDAARVLAADSEPGSWLAHGRTWDEQRYSPLDQIAEGNVGELGLAWSYPTGTKRGLEATPIVVDGVLYATASWSIVFALDAKTGRELWRFDPEVPKAKGIDACCDVVNRGVAVWKGRVYVGALDGRLIALDARSGERIWEVQTTDAAQAYTITGAPRVVKDLVVIGNGGAEIGVRGYFSAYDAASGALRWRFYTVPGPPPPEGSPPEHPEVAVAAKTWSKDSTWEYGLGGTVWDSFAYDPELDLLYVGVGNSSPYDRDRRSPGGGDNLFLASILAVRPDTGRLVWHYQTTPAENWDYTATAHMILAELRIRGRARKVLMQAPKNGFFYVLDRATGELLSAEPYVTVNWASHVDLATGRPVETGRADWRDQVAYVMPSPRGGHNWHPMAFHPGTGLVYIPTIEMAYPFYRDREPRFVPHRYNTGEDFAAMQADIDGFERSLVFCEPTHLTAWDPVAQRRVWRVAHDKLIVGGVLATAGNLVFQGLGTGHLAAFRATDGERLWSSHTRIPPMAAPISYAIDGEQYVAVLVGAGGAAGLNFEVLEYENPGHVLAYKLGGKAALPHIAKLARPAPDPPPLRASPETVEQGRKLYGTYCFRCHGVGTQSGGLLPDLRRSSRAVHKQWRDIVLGGLRQSRGMASFAGVLDAADADAIQAYVIAQALREPTLLESSARWLSKRICLPAAWIAN
jgi:PQQ-dependent dehydrogenase (methanol/ethanol family)